MKNDGTVWTWGCNGEGQLGNGTNTDSFVPIQVPSLSGITAIASGGGFNGFTYALKDNGTVWAWGGNESGQLGCGTVNDWTNIPVQVADLTGVKAIAACAGSYGFGLALKNDGTVWAWGDNTEGQLGNGTYADTNRPVQVTGLTGISAVAAGSHHALALKDDGTVWAWGDNTEGQLGNGNQISTNLPTGSLVCLM